MMSCCFQLVKFHKLSGSCGMNRKLVEVCLNEVSEMDASGRSSTHPLKVSVERVVLTVQEFSGSHGRGRF